MALVEAAEKSSEFLVLAHSLRLTLFLHFETVPRTSRFGIFRTMLKTAIVSAALLAFAVVPSKANTISFSYSGEYTGDSSAHNFDDQVISDSVFTIPNGQHDQITISGFYSGFNGHNSAFQSIELVGPNFWNDIDIPFSDGTIGTFTITLGPGTYWLDFSGTVKKDTDFSVSGIIDPSATPAPASWLLFVSALCLLGLCRITRRPSEDRTLANGATC